MIISNGFANVAEGDEWINLNHIHSFYIELVASFSKQGVILYCLKAKTAWGDVTMSAHYPTQEEAQKELDEAFDCA